LIWAALIALTFTSLTPGSLLLLSLCVAAISQIGTAVNNLSWISWMADLVREEIRGRLGSLQWPWGPFATVFFVSATLRLAALPILLRVHEPREPSAWEAVRVIRNVRAFTTTMGFNRLYHFWLRARRRR
jgi:MFS-type transporter involved in bile tolerance (Atg22 family)